MTKAFKNRTLRAWPAALGLLNTNDGWQEGSGTMSYKQKLVEIPENRRNSFSLQYSVYTTHDEISRYTIIILEVLPQSYIRKDELVFIPTRAADEIVRCCIRSLGPARNLERSTVVLMSGQAS
jgi:hypothetical protein